MTIKILLVDDHAILRKGLRLLLNDHDDLDVVGEAADGDTALKLVQALLPDVVIMDISMPGLNGIDATRQINTRFPETKVIALSIHSEKHYVHDILKAGASGYILKESVPEELVRGIRAVMGGEGYLSPAITGFVVSGYREALSLEHHFEKFNDSILVTKLHQPKLPDTYMHRPRLLQALDKHRQLPLQLIIAPAGYGKTTVASCWINHNDWPAAWLSVDETDNDMRQFLIYFTHAIQQIFPETLSKIDSILNSTNLPPVMTMANKLLNCIEDIGQHFIIVLDDFHRIKENSIYDLFSMLLRYPSHYMHLVVISRQEIFLPLTSLRAQKKLNEIRLIDLKFTEQETGEYLQLTTQNKIDAASIAYWAERTEGWITALHLAMLSVSQQNEWNFIEYNKHLNSQYIMEYLFSEVLEHQDAVFRKSLLSSSILDRFCPSLYEAVCLPEITGTDSIDKLKSDNLFLIALDSGEFWFRYHHLFQELLHKHLVKEFSSKDISSLHARASEWFDRHELTDEAISHALKSDDLSLALKLLERYRRNYQDDHCLNVNRWYDLFPAELKVQRAELLLANAWVLHEQYQLMKIIPIIDQLESIFQDEKPDDASLGELKLFQGILLYWQGKAEVSLRLFRQALKLIPIKYPRIYGLVEIYISVSSCMSGQEEIIQELNDKIQDNDYQDDALLSRLILGRSFLTILSGELIQTLQEVQSVALTSGKPGQTLPADWGNYLQTNCYFLSNKLDVSLPYFVEAIECRYNMHTRASVDTMITLALTYQSLKKTDAAADTMALLRNFILEFNEPELLDVFHSGQARLALAQDDMESASQWLQSFNKTPFAPSMFIWLETPVITQIRVLIAMGMDDNLQQACELLETLLQDLEALHNTFQRILIMPLLALAYSKQGHVNKAIERIHEAVNLAIPGGWIQPFIEPGPGMNELLQKLLATNQDLTSKEIKHIKKILASFNDKEIIIQPEQMPSVDFVDVDVVESIIPIKPRFVNNYLTNREMEILVLLKQRLSNKEISEKLFISTETVKSHLKNLYTKLNAAQRKEAVQKASEIGLI